MQKPVNKDFDILFRFVFEKKKIESLTLFKLKI